MEKENEKELKQRKLNKYLNASYATVVGDISINIAKTYCMRCDIPFSPALFHFCLLPNDEKINEYGREALNIGRKSGLIYKTFRDKVLEKNKRKSFFTDTDIENIKYDKENPKKVKYVKQLARNLFE